MKLYGKRFAKRSIRKETKARQETRDAVLWDILDDNTCRVKIQGSNKFVIAHFPRNWTTVPYWLKAGNAVRVLHRGGNRGYVEVIGEGRAVPTALEGETLPDESTMPDKILSGFEMVPIEDSLGITLSSGTYRINGIVYTSNFDYYWYSLYDSEDYVLFDSESYANYLPDDLEEMPLFLDDAPSIGSFRYDAFAIGEDGVVDYLKGTDSPTPEKPVVPTDHLLLGDYILVIGGSTIITSSDIGRLWEAPYAVTLDIDIEGSGSSYELEWVELETSVDVDIDLQIKDQYGWAYSGYFSGTFNQMSGGGTPPDSTVAFTGSTTLTWTRDQTISDVVPVSFTVNGSVEYSALFCAGIIIPLASS